MRRKTLTLKRNKVLIISVMLLSALTGCTVLSVQLRNSKKINDRIFLGGKDSYTNSGCWYLKVYDPNAPAVNNDTLNNFAFLLLYDHPKFVAANDSNLLVIGEKSLVQKKFLIVKIGSNSIKNYRTNDSLKFVRLLEKLNVPKLDYSAVEVHR
ncbi:MAG: hypothetical protein JST26_05820 [Bacteroidetes bacterium]|nr:hypothetical protein [Bacteroidota bacterium]